MTKSEAWVSLAAAAFALSLGLAACDDGGPEQQSSTPATEDPGDAAAMPESETETETEKTE